MSKNNHTLGAFRKFPLANCSFFLRELSFFTRGGGASVCDRGSPFFGPPFAYAKKLVPPFDYPNKFWSPPPPQTDSAPPPGKK